MRKFAAAAVVCGPGALVVPFGLSLFDQAPAGLPEGIALPATRMPAGARSASPAPVTSGVRAS